MQIAGVIDDSNIVPCPPPTPRVVTLMNQMKSGETATPVMRKRRTKKEIEEDKKVRFSQCNNIPSVSNTS